MRCPNCKQKLLQKSSTATKVRVQGAVEVDPSTALLKSQCYWCKAAVEIPLGDLLGGEPEEAFVFREPPPK